MKEKIDIEEQIMEALKNCNFDDLDDNEDDFYFKVVEPFKEKYHGQVSYATGATKGVLIFNDYNFVIKIPFRYDSNYDDSQFCGANCDCGWDYCEVEASLFSSAEDDHIEECFAKSEFIGEVDGYPIYKQEMATIYASSDKTTTSSHTKEDEEKVENICDTDNYDCFNTNWLSDVFAYFGEEKFYKLMNFIRDYDIKDLHSNNLGYIGMKPVLVDYSSFNE